MGTDAPDPQRLEERIRRLEEAVGFAEHTNEQLNSSIADLSGRIDRILLRLAVIEKRLDTPPLPPTPSPASDTPDVDSLA